MVKLPEVVVNSGATVDVPKLIKDIESFKEALNLGYRLPHMDLFALGTSAAYMLELVNAQLDEYLQSAAEQKVPGWRS